MKETKRHNVFIEGAITSVFVSEAIQKHNARKNIGAHSIFLGQVRNDKIRGQEVAAIEYTTYREMADEKFNEIREDTFLKFSLICMHIYHSIGSVAAGEISLFVFTSSAHRKEAINASAYIVERIKKEVPVWGKEIFVNNDYQWKKNNYE